MKHNVARFCIPFVLILFALCMIQCGGPVFSESKEITLDGDSVPPVQADTVQVPDPPSLDTSLFNQKMLDLVHHQPNERWPVKTDYPLPGALLPFNRIVAYYGNLYSKGMGILGELPPDEMLKKLQEEVAKWAKADTTTPVIPALHYIAVTAQPKPGAGNKYRLRMPFHQIDRILELADQIDAIVFIDIQVGHSTLESEIPEFEKYLSMPNVHLGIDPEYSMKGGQVPCRAIGTFDAADINYASEYLAEIVKKNNLPPKILTVHRFTKGMVTNYQHIKTRPEVQIVMHMDGFGFPAKKIDSYKLTIEKEPVEFTGFKLFYKNDAAERPNIMTPEEILALYPKPVYIQYQ